MKNLQHKKKLIPVYPQKEAYGLALKTGSIRPFLMFRCAACGKEEEVSSVDESIRIRESLDD